VKKIQFLFIAASVALILIIYFLAPTVQRNKLTKTVASADTSHNHARITIETLEQAAFKRLNTRQIEIIQQLKAQVGNPPTSNGYNTLASYWRDSAKMYWPHIYYLAQAAKLDNSEKSLTFAAQFFVDNLLQEQDHEVLHWLAEEGKDLLERALKLNPTNDSSRIGIGVCYMFGGIGNNPMEGILPVKQIAEKNPDNLYAQKILGLGSMQSGQYSKAVERFTILVEKDPTSIEYQFLLAEAYDRLGDKLNAIKWYTTLLQKANRPDIKEALQKRIEELKK
jgi:tetratricopeptide (TPR) repeat protein